MADLYHYYGQDLPLSASGGLLLEAEGSELVNQRVVRRLLTSPGDNLFAQEYGAGLPAHVGQPAQDRLIKSASLKNMRLEAGIDQTKKITIEVFTDPSNGTTLERIAYTDKFTGGASEFTAKIGNTHGS